MAEDQAPPGNINVHTQSVSIQPVPEFNPDSELGASLATKWQTWVDDFEMFLTASDIKDKKQKRVLLLYQAGSRVREIFRQWADTRDQTTIMILRKLNFTNILNSKRIEGMKYLNFEKRNKNQVKPLTNFTLVYRHLPRRAHSPMQILKLSSK